MTTDRPACGLAAEQQLALLVVGPAARAAAGPVARMLKVDGKARDKLAITVLQLLAALHAHEAPLFRAYAEGRAHGREDWALADRLLARRPDSQRACGKPCTMAGAWASARRCVVCPSRNSRAKSAAACSTDRRWANRR